MLGTCVPQDETTMVEGTVSDDTVLGRIARLEGRLDKLVEAVNHLRKQLDEAESHLRDQTQYLAGIIGVKL